MNELQILGEKYGTDKHDKDHSFAGRTYLHVYDSFFKNKKDSVTEFLEIGVLYGNSLKMWRDYFPNAQIWGIDIDPTINKNHGDRIKIITGSQINKNDLDIVSNGKEIDIVIDDGSHLNDHIIESYKILWPRIKPGGLYCIEDLGCTYSRNAYHENWPGMHYNPNNTNYSNDRNKLNDLFLKLIKDMDSRKTDVRGIYFTTFQCIIEKI